MHVSIRAAVFMAEFYGLHGQAECGVDARNSELAGFTLLLPTVTGKGRQRFLSLAIDPYIPPRYFHLNR